MKLTPVEHTYTYSAKCHCGKFFKPKKYWSDDRQKNCPKCYQSLCEAEAEKIIADRNDKMLDEFLESL